MRRSDDGIEEFPFLGEKSAGIGFCDCRIVISLPEIVFLTIDGELVVNPGQKIDFSMIDGEGFGSLAKKMANLLGMGTITISQNPDGACIEITEWSAEFIQLIKSINLLLKENVGFWFPMREERCEKCGCGKPIMLPCGLTIGQAKARLGVYYDPQRCEKCRKLWRANSAMS